MLTYFKVLATVLLFFIAAPAVVAFCGLFFYEGPFSLRQVAIQGGAQWALFTLAYLCWWVADRIWR